MKRLTSLLAGLSLIAGIALGEPEPAAVRENALFSEMVGQFLDTDLKSDPIVVTLPPPPRPGEIPEARTSANPRIGPLSKNREPGKFPWNNKQMEQWANVFSDVSLDDAQRAQKIRAAGGPGDLINAAAFYLLPAYGAPADDPVLGWVEAQAGEGQPKAVLISAALSCFAPKLLDGDKKEKQRIYLRGRQQLLELAGRGNPDASAFLGRQFFFSQNQREKYSSQKEFLEKSARAGDAQSQYLWALYLIKKAPRLPSDDPVGVNAVSLQKSLSQMDRLLSSDKPQSEILRRRYGDLYMVDAEAILWLRKSAENGGMNAAYLMGMLAYNHISDPVAPQLAADRGMLAKAAYAGHFGACYEYALRCAAGSIEGKSVVDAQKMHRDMALKTYRSEDGPWSRADADVPHVETESQALQWLNRASCYGDSWAGAIEAAYLRAHASQPSLAATAL